MDIPSKPNIYNVKPRCRVRVPHEFEFKQAFKLNILNKQSASLSKQILNKHRYIQFK